MAASAPKGESASLPQMLLDEAARLNVDVAGRDEKQVREAVREAWVEENREAMEAWNAWVDAHGIPLERYRAF